MPKRRVTNNYDDYQLQQSDDYEERRSYLNNVFDNGEVGNLTPEWAGTPGGNRNERIHEEFRQRYNGELADLKATYNKSYLSDLRSKYKSIRTRSKRSFSGARLRTTISSDRSFRPAYTTPAKG